MLHAGMMPAHGRLKCNATKKGTKDMLNANEYLLMLQGENHAEIEVIIEDMSHEQRRTLREELKAAGCRQLCPLLYFDYDKQVWI
jgi:ribosome-binding factor A